MEADGQAPVLAVKGLMAGYGAARIIHGIDFALARGEMVVIIGRNGVGKTTLIETLCGLTTYHAGEILLHGQPIHTMPTFRRNRAGLGWVPQEREIFPSLTVQEHLTVVQRGDDWPLDRLYGLFPRLSERRSNYGNQLSGGEQQMLSIARALATGPSVLLLDEPVEGLAPLIVNEMIAAINKLRSQGDITILMIEQKYDIALAHSDRCLVIDHGEIVHQCPSRELLDDRALLEKFVGVAE